MEFHDIIEFMQFVNQNLEELMGLIPLIFKVLGVVGLIYVGFQFWRTGNYNRYRGLFYRMVLFVLLGMFLEYLKEKILQSI